MLFGTVFDEKRPEWCLLLKINQGVIDLLFESKFHDREILKDVSPRKQQIQSSQNKRSNSINNDENLAYQLGR